MRLIGGLYEKNLRRYNKLNLEIFTIIYYFAIPILFLVKIQAGY